MHAKEEPLVQPINESINQLLIPAFCWVCLRICWIMVRWLPSNYMLGCAAR